MKKSKSWITYSIIFIVLLFIVFFPYIASTTFGKGLITTAIQNKTHTKTSVESLHLTWFGPQRFSNLSFENPNSMKGTIHELQIGVPLWSLFSLKKANLLLENGSLELFSTQFPTVTLTEVESHVHLDKDFLDFTASGKTSQNSQNGSFSLQGQLPHLSNPATEFSLKGELISFPTLPIARILGTHHIFEESVIMQIIGTMIDAKGSTSFSQNNGFVDLSLHSSNADGELHGTITDKSLALRAPITMTIRLTPELSDRILSDMNPLFITGIEAKSPVKLRIETSNFNLPLFPIDFKQLQIGHGMLDMGQIRCANGGSLSTIISLLKSNFLGGTKEMMVWFSPLFFSLQNRVLQTNRMDALVADTVHICSWGKIDLAHDQLAMNLGLTADTLNRSFGIDNLPNDYVLKIPVAGSTKYPKLSTGSALAKIAALIAAQKASKLLPGGILNILKPESDVPPPIHPFPWE